MRRVFLQSVTVLCVALAASVAAAQAPNVGSGPLTGTLADTEPTGGVLHVGPVHLAPGIVIRELGWDSNVFGESIDPKGDFVAIIAPDVAAFTRLRFLQLSAYGGANFNYFKTYSDQQSVGHNVRARADVLLSRLRPFVGGGSARARAQPTGEVDVRADRIEKEISGGLAFDVSRYGQVYAAAYEYQMRFQDAFKDGVNLALTLNRDTRQYSAGLRTELTPFLSMTLSGGYLEDYFQADPSRNADTRHLSAGFKIATGAVITGMITAGYIDFKALNPDIRPYRGFVGSAAIVYPILEIGRLGVEAARRNEYSFETDDAYYIENTLALSYTQRLFGELDVQVKGSKSLFDYGFTETSPAREDTLDLVGGSVGYNLRNRTRISLNYEYTRRRSPQLPARNYDRRRLYFAWMFAY